MILEHRRGGKSPTLALVGKGVTFDSGGLCLKPSASMEDMKSDMTGAAVVAAAMQAIARLALPVNVVGYLALTENMTGGKAMKMGDVLDDAERQDGGDHEYRRRGAADPGGRTCLCRRTTAPPGARPGHAYRPASWRWGSRLPGSSVTTTRSARSLRLLVGRPASGSAAAL